MRSVLSKKRWHSSIDFKSILPFVTMDNNILELQGLFEHKVFVSKPTTRCNVNIYPISIKILWTNLKLEMLLIYSQLTQLDKKENIKRFLKD